MRNTEDIIPEGIEINLDENGLPIIDIVGLPYLVPNKEKVSWNEDWDYNI